MKWLLRNLGQVMLIAAYISVSIGSYNIYLMNINDLSSSDWILISFWFALTGNLLQSLFSKEKINGQGSNKESALSEMPK